MGEQFGRSDDEGHVPFAWHCHFFALPQRIVDGESIDCDGQMFGMHLGKAFSTRVVSIGKRTNVRIIFNLIQGLEIATN